MVATFSWSNPTTLSLDRKIESCSIRGCRTQDGTPNLFSRNKPLNALVLWRVASRRTPTSTEQSERKSVYHRTVVVNSVRTTGPISLCISGRQHRVAAGWLITRSTLSDTSACLTRPCFVLPPADLGSTYCLSSYAQTLFHSCNHSPRTSCGGTLMIGVRIFEAYINAIPSGNTSQEAEAYNSVGQLKI